MKKNLIIGSCVLLFAACGNLEEKNGSISAVRPPFQGVDVASKNYVINSDEEAVIRTTTGTRITIPAKSLVDAKGKSVSGKVTVSFREIHTPAEILASGIPMRYDSSGTNYDFVSAGMFEINATQEKQPLEIQSGQKIEVELASYKEDSGYSFYELEKQNGDWSNLGIKDAKKNEEKYLHLQSFKDENLVAFDIDYSTNPELEPFQGINWTYVGKNKQLDPLKNKWILKEHWRNIQLATHGTKTGTYTIVLSNKKKRIELEMTPYFMEDQLEQQTLFASQVEQYESLVVQKKQEENKIQLQADITRSFAISEFGLYNWDKISKIVEEEQLAVVNASFSIDGQPITTASQVYFIDGEEKILSRETAIWEKLVFQPKAENWLILVLPDNRAAVCDAKMFRKLKDQTSAVFELKTAKKRIESIADIQELLKKS